MTGRALLLAPLLLACACLEAACQPAGPPLPTEARLARLWASYLTGYVRDSGEVVDPLRDGHVSSEAQSYALLRAVWMRDHATFDRVHAWTRAHLRRPDGLHAWLWDPATQRLVDPNTATDGDIDIAWALAMAAVVFDEPTYAAEARTIVQAIRQHASVRVGDAWLPSAGNWAGPERIVNLSYFYPYVAPWFERLDPGQGWTTVNAVGYDLLEQALREALLPVDFNRVDEAGRLLAMPENHMLSRHFSYDSIRVAWRLELACRLGDRTACGLATRLVERLATVHERDGGFFTRYGADGTALDDQHSISFEGALLPAFTRVRPALARQWRASRLDEGALDALGASRARYYDANWVWFGLALADGVLTKRLPRADQLPRRAGR